MYLNWFYIEFTLQDLEEFLKCLFLFKNHIFIKSLISINLMLISNKATESQCFGLLLFVINFNIISPICLNTSIDDRIFQKFQNIKLEILEFFTINHNGFGELHFTFFSFTHLFLHISGAWQELWHILMRSNSWIVYLFDWLRELTITKQFRIFLWLSSNWQHIINITNLTEVWANRIQKQQLQVNISFNQIESWLSLTTVEKICISFTNKLVKTKLNYITINHALICFFNFGNLILNFAFKYSIKFRNLFIFVIWRSISFMLLERFSQKHLKSGKLQNSSIGNLLSKVGIVNWITCLCTCHSSCVSTILLDSIYKGDEVSLRFGHLFALYIYESIAEKWSRPFALVILPNCSMIEQCHGQVIFN